MKKLILTYSIILYNLGTAQIKPHIATYLGDGQRNFYGNVAPSKLRIKWKIHLGTATTTVWNKKKVWSGAGWTGQPIVISENNEKLMVE